MDNIDKHLENKLTYFHKDGIDFEVIKMEREDKFLKCIVIAAKGGDRLKINNPIRIANPEINITIDGEEVENPREAFKEMIYKLI